WRPAPRPRGAPARFAAMVSALERLVLPPRPRRATLPAMSSEPASETIRVPASVRFPVELEPPEGFRPEEPASWPRIDGRLEWVGGRLLYMPPRGAVQQGVSVGVVTILGQWGEEHPEFFVGGNEAVMILCKVDRCSAGVVRRRESMLPYSATYILLTTT